VQTILLLPNGRQIRSGVAGETSVQSLTLTQCVNAGTELNPGSVCAAMAEIRLWTYGDLALEAGQEIRILDGEGTQLGIFRLEKPTCPTANTIALTAYDRIVRLDKDLTAWLAGRTYWPCPLQDLARDICSECGLELAQGEIPNGEYQVPKFTAEGVTGRALLQWIAQIAGRFVRATADGKAEFAWYVPADIAIAPDSRASRYVSARDGEVTLELPDPRAASDGQGNLTVACPLLSAQAEGENVTITAEAELPAVFYYQDGLSYESYETETISRVVLRQSGEDVGVGFPSSGGENPLCITANPMLSGDKEALLSIAQELYRQLQDVSYTPCRVCIASTNRLCPGNTVQVQDKNGRFFTAYIMSRRRSGGRDVLECTGSYRRGTAAEVNEQSFATLQGRVLKLRKDMDGLFLSHEDAKENAAKLQLTLSGLQAQVEQQSEAGKVMSSLEQSAREMALRIQTLEKEGASQVKTETGYTFDQNGLHIQKSGQEMDNTLDHTGMYVRRGGTTLLQANHRGVEAADVTVHNYLIVGQHARLEDYDGGTGCFWI